MARRRSNTIRNRFEDEEIQTTTPEVEDCDSQQTVKIILRRTNKISRVLEVPFLLHLHKLQKIVKKEFFISQQNQVLFWKGQRISQNQFNKFQMLCFSTGDIINVHSKEIFGRQSAEIYLQFLNSDFVKYKELKKTVNSQSTISNSLSEKFNLSPQEIKNCVCVQSGRFLKKERTFEEEAIQDESLILLFFNSVKQQSLPILQQRQMKLLQIKINKNKTASQQFTQAQKKTNFKKKLKIFSCKSMILPESLELIWQQDTSDEYECKNLAKTFLMKKNEIIPRSSCKLTQIEFNDSKSDTSICEKPINLEISFEETSAQSLYNKENSMNLPKSFSSCCFEQSALKQNLEIESTEYCPYYPSGNYNMNGHENLKQEAFSLCFAITNQQK